MGNLRNPPLLQASVVARRLITDIATIAHGIAEVPILPIKLVDQPKPSAMPAKRKAQKAEKTRLDSSHAAAVNDTEISAPPVDSCATGIDGGSGRSTLPESAPVRADGEPCPMLPDWPDAPLPEDFLRQAHELRIGEAGTRASPPVLASVRKPITAGKLRKAERNQRIAAAYAAGGECREIAAREGLSRTRVLAIVNTEGVPSRQVGKNRRIPDLDRQAVADLYANGMPLRAVADRFGVSKSTAKACLIELGAQLRPVGKRSPAYQPKPKIPKQPKAVSAPVQIRLPIHPIPHVAGQAEVKSCSRSPVKESGRDGMAARESVSQNPLAKPEAGALAAGEKRSPTPPTPDSGTSGAGFYSEAAVKARAQEAGRKRAHAENAAKAERKLSRRSAQADFEDRAVSEFEAALAKVRARKAGAVEVIAPKPAAPQDEGKRLAAAFAAKAVQKSTSVPAATGPTKHAPGREECPRCGIPGLKGCAHFLPCEDQPVRVALPQDDAEYDGRVTSTKHRTGGRQAVRL